LQSFTEIPYNVLFAGASGLRFDLVSVPSLPSKLTHVYPKPALRFGLKVVSISCGQAHCAVITTAGFVMTWGVGQNGRLGHGSCINVDAPKVVTALLAKGSVTKTSPVVGNAGKLSSGTNEGANFRKMSSKEPPPTLTTKDLLELSNWPEGAVRAVGVSCGDKHTAIVVSIVPSFSKCGCEIYLLPDCIVANAVPLTPFVAPNQTVDGHLWVWGGARSGALGLGEGLQAQSMVNGEPVGGGQGEVTSEERLDTAEVDSQADGKPPVVTAASCQSAVFRGSCDRRRRDVLRPMLVTQLLNKRVYQVCRVTCYMPFIAVYF
jgi:hypothetical protein